MAHTVEVLIWGNHVSHHLVQKSSFGLHSEVALVAQSNWISPKVVVTRKSSAAEWHIRGWMSNGTSNIGSHLSLDASKAATQFKLEHNLLGQNLELRWNCEVLVLGYLLTDYGSEVLVLQVLAPSNSGRILQIISLRGWGPSVLVACMSPLIIHCNLMPVHQNASIT